ncbi:MAG TPA: penicillin-binding protein 2 [Caulobacteraceae bacterium]|nr:penicillin-binding protein 2 [Caulobacteraceae bacterium]
MSLGEVLANPLPPMGRWIGRRLWWVEHAFERARASERAVDDTRLRIFFVLALFCTGFAALSLGAARAALFSPYDQGVEAAAPALGARADLVDRRGELLALDLPRYGLYLDPQQIVRKAAVRAALLAALPAIEPAKLDRALAGDRQEFIVGGLTPAAMTRLHALAVPGVSFEPQIGRDYPLGALGAHLIGFASKDGVGLAGAEKAFDAAIRADGGKRPVALSIDLRVQGALHDELARAAKDYAIADGAGLVVDVRTGEILAMASWPDFDANRAGEAAPAALINHAAASVYEPGSVMKVFTLATGLDLGVATTDTVFDVARPLVLQGQTIHDYDTGDTALPLWEVFTHSSNIGAAKLGLMIGAQRFSRYYHAYGLFSAAPSVLRESAWPIAPRILGEDTIASMSFGQAISVSPLALATGMSAILNGGLYRPLTLTPVAPGAAPAPGRRVIKASTSRTMLNLMRLNVLQGTGAKADVAGLRVGGKTGTATKVVDGRYVKGRNALNLASFAAVFPTDGPLDADRYLVLVMLDEPRPTAADSGVTTGGLTAAPTAARVIRRIAPFLGVRRVIIASDLAPKPALAVSAPGQDQ